MAPFLKVELVLSVMYVPRCCADSAFASLTLVGAGYLQTSAFGSTSTGMFSPAPVRLAFGRGSGSTGSQTKVSWTWQQQFVHWEWFDWISNNLLLDMAETTYVLSKTERTCNLQHPLRLRLDSLHDT